MRCLFFRMACPWGSNCFTTAHRRAGVLGLMLGLVLIPANAESISGTVEFAEIHRLNVGVSGEVASVSVREGDQVLAGTLLMALGDTVYKAEVEAETAQMAWREALRQEALRSWERDNVLFEEGSLSAVELDLSRIARLRVEADYQHSVARHAASLSRLNRSRIVAPEAGIVLEQNVNPGERINIEIYTGPAMVFASSNLVVRARITNGAANLPLPGQPIQLDFADKSIMGSLQSVVPGVNGDDTVVTVTTADTLPPPGSSVQLHF